MRRPLAVAVLSLAVAVAAFAQREPANAPIPPPNTPGGEPFVYYAHSYRTDNYNRAGLGERISVHVQNFETLLSQARGDCRQIVLFIDGLAIKGVQPESCDRQLGHVRYRLQRTADSDDAWHALLGSPHHFWRPVSISVGSDPQFSVKSGAVDFQLEILPARGLVIFSIVIGIAFLICLWLCVTTSLIRSGSPDLKVRQRPYSLSLFQMAFWFFLVIAGYVFVWLITGELDTITASVLALIGIGAATAISATLIDNNKPVPVTNEPSAGFIKDILTDATGVSLHRFQMFVWTLVLGVIFVVSVYRSLEMPEFSATLLGLMGISSGTYLGFKMPEKGSPDQTVAPPPPMPVAQPQLPPPSAE